MADVIIEASAHDSAAQIGGGPFSVCFVDASNGYIFYVQENGSTDPFVYRKTTDGGSSWGSAVTIESTVLTLQRGSAIWYDQWTPGDSGTKIHITWGNSSTDCNRYRSLDTSSDTLSTTVSGPSPGALASGTAIYQCSISKSKGGNLYMSLSDGTTTTFSRSTNGGTSFAARTNLFETGADIVWLTYGNEADTNDIYAFYYDASATEISLKTYDDSANTWSEVSISTGITITASTNAWSELSYGINLSNSHIFVCFWNSFDVSTADLLCYEISDATTITSLTNVVTNSDDCFCAAVHCNGSDVYCGYLGKSDGSETAGSAVKVYYKKSTDGGVTWGTETAYSENSAGNEKSLWVTPTVTPSRVYFVWFDDTNNDLIGGFTNSIATTVSSTDPSQPNMVSQMAAQANW